MAFAVGCIGGESAVGAVMARRVLESGDLKIMPDSSLKQSTILIVDDEKANVRLLEMVLAQAGYTNVFSTLDSRETRALFCQLRPDLLLLDLAMPHLDGFEVMRQLRDQTEGANVPILMLTADATTGTRHRALEAGARDFLTKPLDQTEVTLRIENLLRARLLHNALEEKVRERTGQLELAQLETLQRLALAAEYRDDDTGLHTKRVGHTAGLIARQMGLSPARAELIARAAPLHDVGKIGVSDSILLKPGKLTDAEFAAMKRHTHIGAQMLGGSSSPWLQLAEEIALHHHERWDGRGYGGLRGEQIPLSGRIVAVADVFDALTHERPYKRAWSVEQAAREIEAGGDTQFDARVVEAFGRTGTREFNLKA